MRSFFLTLSRLQRFHVAVLSIFMLGVLCSSSVIAQNNNNQNNNNNFGGITIDGEGVVKSTPPRRISKAALINLQESFAKENLSPEIVEQSEARTVSLVQLNGAVTKSFAFGTPVPAGLRYLAGLQRIDFVVFDRDNRDILLVGPAEGFGPGLNDRIVGTTTGRPPIQLDDLVVALRSTFSGEREMGVSIDPTDENMANLQNYLRRNSNAVTTSAAQQRYQMMARILGMQQVTLWGVPHDSHFALALTEADLKMKRIALGQEPAGVPGIRSHLSLLLPQGNSLQRWWFAPFYEPIGTNADRTVFEIKGQRAQVMAQEERVRGDGSRDDAAFTRQTTEKFAELFTTNFEQLAMANPTFAELQNLYDLSVAAALIRRECPFDCEAALEALLNDHRLPLETYPVPKSVPSSSVNRMAARGLLIGLIGGVTIDVRSVVQDIEPQPELIDKHFERPTVSDNWWWNAAPDTSKPNSTDRQKD